MNSAFAPGHHFWVLFSWLYHQLLWGFPYGHPQEKKERKQNKKHKLTQWTRSISTHTLLYVGCNTACYSQGAEKKTFKTTESKHKWPLVGMNTHVCLAEGMKHFPKPALPSKSQWWLIRKYTEFLLTGHLQPEREMFICSSPLID